MARKKLETLTEQMYYVLLSLWTEPRHGYGIMGFTEKLTQGRVTVGAGTLYALLSRFETEGLIQQVDAREGRKYYALTDQGRKVLSEEFRRLKAQVQNGADILEAAEGGNTP